MVLATMPVISPMALLQLTSLWSTERALTWILRGWENVSLLDLGVEGWANVAMYAVVAFAWSRLGLRAHRVAVSLCGASYLFESLQAGLYVRIADPRDLYANCLGAFIGVGIAHLASTPDLRLLIRSRAWWRRTAIAGIALAVMLALAGEGIRELADREQAALNASLRRAYGETTLVDVLKAGESDRYLQFSSLAGVPSDYLGLVTDDVAQARYGIGSTAHPRCVVLTWAARQPVSFVNTSGPACLQVKVIGLPGRKGS